MTTIRRPHRMHPFPAGQSGAVLLVGLIILLVLTVIGTSGITSVTLEERMVSNMQNANKSFQGAEAVLSECESFIRDSDYAVLEASTAADISGLSAGTHRIVPVGLFGSSDWWSDQAFWAMYGTASELASITASVDGLAVAPKCVTEYIGNGKSSVNVEDLYAGTGTTSGDRLLYRVTAFSYGADYSSQATVESLFVK